MAAKSELNELYQRLRTAAPVYTTQLEAQLEGQGFLCDLTLPAVGAAGPAPLRAPHTFAGRGTTKKVSTRQAQAWLGRAFGAAADPGTGRGP
jgi:hypothetical protein